ncbi:hypothetical protein WMF26_32025 [Sorangium sp. So ce185]|uniref:hypothetical protein n=1 Tax=Sorangium sp. So ce185 TaxID=3133287 RepID=UPI003F5F2390
MKSKTNWLRLNITLVAIAFMTIGCIYGIHRNTTLPTRTTAFDLEGFARADTDLVAHRGTLYLMARGSGGWVEVARTMAPPTSLKVGQYQWYRYVFSRVTVPSATWRRTSDGRFTVDLSVSYNKSPHALDHIFDFVFGLAFHNKEEEDCFYDLIDAGEDFVASMNNCGVDPRPLDLYAVQ